MEDREKIQMILQDALEEEIPSSEVQLWPAVKEALAAGTQRLDQQGETMKPQKSTRRPRLAQAALAAVLLLAAVFATPQGRAFAQSLLQFFIPAENTNFPLSPEQIEAGEMAPDAPTAEPPSPLISVAEAESQLGFDIYELPVVPDGFTYLGARLYGSTVSIEYQAEGMGGNLILQQSQAGYYQSDWDQVPAEAVVPVQVGEYDAEFAQGTFVVFAGDTEATWNPDASILRLRWRQGGTYFDLTKFGNVEAIEYLDQAGLIALAESLVSQP